MLANPFPSLLSSFPLPFLLTHLSNSFLIPLILHFILLLSKIPFLLHNFSSLLPKGIFNASSLSNSSQTLYRKENKAYYWPCGPAAQTGVEHVRPPYPYPFGRRTDGSLKNP